jgi:hypothetical protein
METLFLISLIVISSIVIYYFSKGIIAMFDYGNILYPVIKKIAIKHGADIERFQAMENEILKVEYPIVDRMKNIKTYLYKVADQNNNFKLWICEFCLSIRLAIFTDFFIIGFFAYYFTLKYLILYPLTVILTIAVITLLDKK